MAVVLLIPYSNPASFTLSLSLSPPTNHHNHRHPILRPTTASAFKPQRFSVSPAVSFPLQSRDNNRDRDRDRDRGLSLVTRAGPSTNSYILAFVLPFSLVVITVLTSIRISDKLDQDYLEEVALNQAIREADEEEGEEEDYTNELPLEQPATPRARNRPKREA